MLCVFFKMAKFLNMSSNTILKHAFHFFPSDTLLSEDKMIDRMNMLMRGKGIKDLQFEHSDDPHGKGVNIGFGKPRRMLIAT